MKKAKGQKVQKKKRTKTDKKGFRVLTDKHDFYELFGQEKKTGKEDFGRIFEESLQDRHQQLLLEEKRVASPKEKPLTLREQIKAYPAPQAELDLHGKTASEAEENTEVFISHSREKRIRTVRLIVGKGTHSQGKAVLPDVVEKKIIHLKRQKWILDYQWEKKDKRKSGAMIVYLIPGK